MKPEEEFSDSEMRLALNSSDEESVLSSPESSSSSRKQEDKDHTRVSCEERKERKDHTDMIFYGFLVGSRIPFSNVDSEYFRNFMHAISPQTVVLNQEHFASMIPTEYTKIKKVIVDLLDKSPPITLVCELWINHRKQNIFGLTAVASINWKPKHLLLSVEYMEEAPSVNSIRARASRVINEFGIEKKSYFCITNDATSTLDISDAVGRRTDDEFDGEICNFVVSPSDELLILPCFNKTIQEIIRTALDPSIYEALGMQLIAKIIAFVHNSASMRAVIDEIHGVDFAIPRWVKTRWNWCFHTLTCMVKVPQESLEFALNDCFDFSEDLSQLNREMLKEVRMVLEPLRNITLHFERTIFGRIAAVIPEVLLLGEELKEMDLTFDEVRGLRDRVISEVQSSFAGIFELYKCNSLWNTLSYGNQYLLLALVLDPSVEFSWLDTMKDNDLDKKEKIRKFMLDECVQPLLEFNPKFPPTSFPETKLKKTYSGSREKRGAVSSSVMTPPSSTSATTGDTETQIRSELVRYQEIVRLSDTANDAWEFWPVYAKMLPNLYNAAMSVLTVPTSSTKIERKFGRREKLYCPVDCPLSTTSWEKIAFLEGNLALAMEYSRKCTA